MFLHSYTVFLQIRILYIDHTDQLFSANLFKYIAAVQRECYA